MVMKEGVLIEVRVSLLPFWVMAEPPWKRRGKRNPIGSWNWFMKLHKRMCLHKSVCVFVCVGVGRVRL